ncbi:uncharacterized protein EHS24_009278 [Apiotrichum porosum]|uniref:VWFA domain-containing protein n=1 Tax=Apiotrichum porosum TaxID=105984 RepID=A0A427XL91_9TREE|nr:uncharacterized protein EHS24_009278 [Apiotrichum porosum]RSH79626.1 hypothetical protein EHS24_009278 [Apiotrichum porosum]
MLEKKVLKPLVLDPAKHGTLRKPVLVIAITDGEPYGESRDKTAEAIIHAKKHLERSKYGADAVSFSFAQVGNDAAAQRFLSSLDNDPKIGSLIDQTMEFDQEAAEVRQKLNGFELTPELWLLKLLLGGIDVAYDMKDERH